MRLLLAVCFRYLPFTSPSGFPSTNSGEEKSLERFSEVTGGWVRTWRFPAHLGLHDLQWTSSLFPSSNDETLFTLRFRKRTPLVARFARPRNGPASSA